MSDSIEYDLRREGFEFLGEAAGLEVIISETTKDGLDESIPQEPVDTKALIKEMAHVAVIRDETLTEL